MCMLFLYLDDTPEDGRYKLILASNRDETWQRPTAPAAFRGDNSSWIGGIDLEPGKEGGTWLGLTTTGKLGVLLNIMSVPNPDLRGRGSLVTDFLLGHQTCAEYHEELSQQRSLYSPFHLVLLDLCNKEKQSVHYLTNSKDSSEHVRELSPGVHAFDNSMLERPRRKRVEGEKVFSDLVRAHGSPSSRGTLVSGIIDMLNDKTSYVPDPQLEKQFKEVGYPTTGDLLPRISALNVFSPDTQYGTRTNTVILVDHYGNCEYIERTLITPVDVEHPSWTTQTHKFTIGTET